MLKALFSVLKLSVTAAIQTHKFWAIFCGYLAISDDYIHIAFSLFCMRFNVFGLKPSCHWKYDSVCGDISPFGIMTDSIIVNTLAATAHTYTLHTYVCITYYFLTWFHVVNIAGSSLNQKRTKKVAEIYAPSSRHPTASRNTAKYMHVCVCMYAQINKL